MTPIILVSSQLLILLCTSSFSPFKLRVLPTHDASKVVASGPGLTTGVPASFPVEFTIDAKDAGEGQLSVQITVSCPEGCVVVRDSGWTSEKPVTASVCGEQPSARQRVIGVAISQTAVTLILPLTVERNISLLVLCSIEWITSQKKKKICLPTLPEGSTERFEVGLSVAR